jgi:hypothetical protein
MLAAGIIVVRAVLGASGALAPVGPGLVDVALFVRFGLPRPPRSARFVRSLDLSAALTIGGWVLAAWLVAPEPGGSPKGPDGYAAAARTRWLRLSGGPGMRHCCGFILTASDVSGLRGERNFAVAVASFGLQTDLGRELGLSLMTNNLAIHLVAVCLWVGGLAALVVVVPGRGRGEHGRSCRGTTSAPRDRREARMADRRRTGHRQIGSVRMRRSGCTMLSRIWNVQDGTYGQS